MTVLSWKGGVLRACYKRPVAAADIRQRQTRSRQQIFSREEKEIPSSQIGEIVMESLKKLDRLLMYVLHRYTGNLKT